MRDHSRMATRRLRTRDYPESARLRLGDAVTKAREAAGYRWRTDFAKAAGGINVRSLEYLETGATGVGQSILFAVGRTLPGWTEETPRIILEGGPIPPIPDETSTADAAAQEEAHGAHQPGPADGSALPAGYNPATGEIDRVAAVQLLVDLIPGIRQTLGDAAADEMWQHAMDLAVKFKVLDQVAAELQDAKQA